MFIVRSYKNFINEKKSNLSDTAFMLKGRGEGENYPVTHNI